MIAMHSATLLLCPGRRLSSCHVILGVNLYFPQIPQVRVQKENAFSKTLVCPPAQQTSDLGGTLLAM